MCCEPPPGNTGNAGLSGETGATISRRRYTDQGCEKVSIQGWGRGGRTLQVMASVD